MTYDLAKSNTNIDLSENIYNNEGRNSYKENINKCFSYNFDYLKNNSTENDNDIKNRINSSKNMKYNNNIKNDCSYNDSLKIIETKHKKNQLIWICQLFDLSLQVK